MLTIDEIKQALHEFDLQIRPKVIFINPSDAEFVKSVLPNIEKELVVQFTPFVEKGKMYLVNRKDLEFKGKVGVWQNIM